MNENEESEQKHEDKRRGNGMIGREKYVARE
jgi:hypothetical protein